MNEHLQLESCSFREAEQKGREENWAMATEALNRLGKVKLVQKKFDQAKAYIKRALSLYPLSRDTIMHARSKMDLSEMLLNDTQLLSLEVNWLHRNGMAEQSHCSSCNLVSN